MSGWRGALTALVVAGVVVGFSANGLGQAGASPFEVSNPKHLKWPVEQAGRIYLLACDLVARSLRPDKPPMLRPKFVLVLGAKQDQMMRTEKGSEVRLKKWNAETFAEGVVLLSLRESEKDQNVLQLAHHTLAEAEATVSVRELAGKR